MLGFPASENAQVLASIARVLLYYQSIAKHWQSTPSIGEVLPSIRQG